MRNNPHTVPGILQHLSAIRRSNERGDQNSPITHRDTDTHIHPSCDSNHSLPQLHAHTARPAPRGDHTHHVAADTARTRKTQQTAASSVSMETPELTTGRRRRGFDITVSHVLSRLILQVVCCPCWPSPSTAGCSGTPYVQ